LSKSVTGLAIEFVVIISHKFGDSRLAGEWLSEILLERQLRPAKRTLPFATSARIAYRNRRRISRLA
jgi:hypothetical protein